MQSFENVKGEKFVFEITIGSARRLAAAYKFDLLSQGEDAANVVEFLSRMTNIYNAVWFLCRDQAATVLNGVKDGESLEDVFFDRLNTDIGAELAKKFISEVELFIHALNPEFADAFGAMLKKTKELTTMQAKASAEFVASAEADEMMQREIDRAIMKARNNLNQTFGEPLGG